MAGKEPVPEWLPPGWKVGVKVRRSGVKDRTYIHPTNGLKFRSKYEVLRYINTPETSTEKATPESDPTKLNAKQRNNSVESLPEGWIIELKLRKNGVLAGRSDKYFIETSTGYKFNSMTRVRNYLSAKHREMFSTEHSLEKPASVTRGRKLRQIRPKQSLFEEQISNCNPSVKVDEFTSMDNPDSGLNGPGSSAYLDKDATNLTVEQGDKIVQCKDAKPKKETVIQDLSNTMPSEGSLKVADPNQVLDMNYEVNKNTNDSEVQLTHLKDGSPVERKRTKQLVSKSKRKQDCYFQSVPRRSGRLAALKDVLNADFEATSEQNSILTTKPSLKGLSNGELLKEGTNAGTSSQSKPLTSEDAKNKANCQLQPSFSDLWSDPCLEFAFKTLTGIIPIECMPSNEWLSPSAASVKLQVSGGNQDVK